MAKDNLQMSIALRRSNHAESTAYGHYSTRKKEAFRNECLFL